MDTIFGQWKTIEYLKGLGSIRLLGKDPMENQECGAIKKQNRPGGLYRKEEEEKEDISILLMTKITLF